MSNQKKKGLAKLGTDIWKNRVVYTLLLPALAWYIIFAYAPLTGLQLAFKDFKANLGIWGSPWIGFENFEYVFRDALFWKSIGKTLSINIGRMLIEFPAPIILALLLNEFRSRRYKRVLQTVFTFPHFFSWIIVTGILTNALNTSGIVNQIITTLGGAPVNFLGNPGTFIPMLYITNIWKGAGYGSIIYLASISGIDTGMYEAADLDGATRWQELIYITIPSILPTIVFMFILTAGGLMTAGFDQIFNLSNAAVKDVSETLDIYIYRITFQSAADFPFSTAVSLFRSVVSMILLLGADRVSRLLGGGGLIGRKEVAE
ncbi:protein lplB [Spirochaetia bacterium]|nr:protein lplB [Spirochaetia bacterium]